MASVFTINIERKQPKSLRTQYQVIDTKKSAKVAKKYELEVKSYPKRKSNMNFKGKF